MTSPYLLPRLAKMTLMTALVVALAGCEPDVSEVEELRGLPEAQLAYPGSEEVDWGGDISRNSITGTQPAFAWRLIGTNATVDELFEWYADELETDGWITGGGSSALAATGELDATAWERDGLKFRLSVLDPERTRPELQGDWAHLYRTSLIVDRDTK